MKKILLSFTSLLYVLAANAQTDGAVMLHTNNIASYSSSSADNSFIATLPSGENIVASAINDLSGNPIINIKKIQSNGTVVTIVNLQVPLIMTLKGLSCSASGNFTCLFWESTNLYLVKFTSTGTIASQKMINVPDMISPYYNHTLTETPSGDYYLSVSDFTYMGIIKIDTNGNLLWNKKVTGPRGTGKCPGFCIDVTQSGGCIATLKDQNYETIVNLAPDGSLNWSRSFTDLSYRWTRSIKSDNLGNFYIMGTYGSTGATFVQKMDANGNFIYAKNISGTTTYQDSHLTASNELYLITESPSVQLIKLGATGNILWRKGIGATIENTAYMYTTYFSKTSNSNISFLAWVNDSTDVIFKFSGDPSELCNSYNNTILNTTDDAQILGAEIDSTINIDPLAVTVTNTGFGTSATEYYTSENFCSFIASVNETATNVDLNIYPNPASEFITIDLSNFKNGTLQNALIVIYDMTGKKVFEKQVDNSSMEKIETAEYTSGLYTIVIANTSTILGKQRVIIQK